MTDTAQALVSTLRGFGITAEVADVQTGAAVDRYALQLAPGTPVRSVVSKADDIALAIAASSVRVYPIPGTKFVGVEIPAAERQTIPLEAVAAGMPDAHPLRFPVGVDVAGKGVSARVDKLPHLIVAGQTGSGKSVFVSAMLAHLVTHADPERLQLILIDPKRVELAPFAGIRHLARPVVTDVAHGAVDALDAAVAEMDARWRMLEEAGKRNVADLPDPPPYLVIVIDELADLMMTAGKRVEGNIVRLLQLGRAAGVHLILATQRPSTDVITGLIKTNAPSRMVFAVSSHTDSNVALGQSGAERLLGQGDGLWWPAGASQPERIQGAFLADDELEDILAPLREDAPPLDVVTEPDDCPQTRELLPDHVCACRRDAEHSGAHACRTCDRHWPPTAPVQLPLRAERIEAASVPMSGEPMSPREKEEGPPPSAPTPAEPPMPPEVPTTFYPEHFDRDVDIIIQAAYDKGRRHGQLAMELPTHRVTIGRDWAVAILLGLLAVVVGIIGIPILPAAFGVWVGWTVIRHRTRVEAWRRR